MKQLLLVIIGLAVVLSGCEGDSSPPSTGGDSRELLIYCGAGIRPPVEELVQVFGEEHGVKIVTDYAGSEVLLSKIKLVRKGDIYLPGDKHYLEQAEEEDMILSQEPVCYFVPTILVQKDNPRNIRGLEDLLQPDLKLGLGDPKACAIGRKTWKLLEKNNIPWEKVEENLVFPSLTVNELGMQIQAQALDAVIVWDAIARYYPEEGAEIPIPVSQNIISTVNIGLLSFTVNREAAERFIAFAASGRGRAIFKKHLYRVDPPE